MLERTRVNRTNTNSSLNQDLLHQAKIKGLSLPSPLTRRHRRSAQPEELSVRPWPQHTSASAAAKGAAGMEPPSSHLPDQRRGRGGVLCCSATPVLRGYSALSKGTGKQSSWWGFSVESHRSSSFLFNAHTIKGSELSSLGTSAPLPSPSSTIS